MGILGRVLSAGTSSKLEDAIDAMGIGALLNGATKADFIDAKRKETLNYAVPASIDIMNAITFSRSKSRLKRSMSY